MVLTGFTCDYQRNVFQWGKVWKQWKCLRGWRAAQTALCKAERSSRPGGLAFMTNDSPMMPVMPQDDGASCDEPARAGEVVSLSPSLRL